MRVGFFIHKRVSVLSFKRKEHRIGEVISVIQAFEGCAVEGGKDARVQLVFEAGQVECWLDARQGVTQRDQPASANDAG